MDSPLRIFRWVSAAGPEADAGRSLGRCAPQGDGDRTGRPGRSRRRCGRSLAGVDVPDVDVADVDVYVFVETLTPMTASRWRRPRPTVAVLNKADLAGFRGSDR